MRKQNKNGKTWALISWACFFCIDQSKHFVWRQVNCSTDVEQLPRRLFLSVYPDLRIKTRCTLTKLCSLNSLFMGLVTTRLSYIVDILGREIIQRSVNVHGVLIKLLSFNNIVPYCVFNEFCNRQCCLLSISIDIATYLPDHVPATEWIWIAHNRTYRYNYLLWPFPADAAGKQILY